MDQNDGNPLPEHVLESIRQNGTALKGPITTPVGGGFRSVNVGLRKSLDLYGQVRPCKSYPGVRSRYANVDLIVDPREHRGPLRRASSSRRAPRTPTSCSTGSRSKGYPNIRRDSGISIKPISETGTRQIVQFAFDYARRNGRRKVTAIHKANIMKFTDGLFLHVAAGRRRGERATSSSRTGSSTTSRCSSCSGRRSTTSSCCRTSTGTSSPTSAPA